RDWSSDVCSSDLAEKQRYFVKRFLAENTLNPQPFYFSEHPNSFIELVTTQKTPIVDLIFAKVKGVEREPETVNLEEFIAVKGIKAQGNQLTTFKVKQMNLHPAEEEPEEEILSEEEEDATLGEQASLFDFPVSENGESQENEIEQKGEDSQESNEEENK